MAYGFKQNVTLKELKAEQKELNSSKVKIRVLASKQINKAIQLRFKTSHTPIA
jgi:HKD family nuclease